MILTDHITLDARTAKKTREGFLVAEPRVARTGIQDYFGADLGLTGADASKTFKVYRDEAEVFATDALRSFSAIDVTIDHPTKMVDAKNWRNLAVGSTGEGVLRDGEFLRCPIIVKDQVAIDAIDAGKAELSVGYTCDLLFEPGTTAGGEAYDARQTKIRANHLAICDRARGGSLLRIGDHQGEPPVSLKTITFDGLQVADVSPAAEAVITKLQGLVADAVKAKDTASADVVRLQAEAVAKDAEIVTLKDAVEKAKITPQAMRDAVKAFAAVTAKAKAMGATITDAMGETEIMRAVVDAKMKDVKDEHLQVAFDALTAAVKVDDAGHDAIRTIVGDGLVNTNDATKDAQEARDARMARFATAHTTKAA